jgi:hypothetical protein
MGNKIGEEMKGLPQQMRSGVEPGAEGITPALIHKLSSTTTHANWNMPCIDGFFRFGKVPWIVGWR